MPQFQIDLSENACIIKWWDKLVYFYYQINIIKANAKWEIDPNRPFPSTP